MCYKYCYTCGCVYWFTPDSTWLRLCRRGLAPRLENVAWIPTENQCPNYSRDEVSSLTKQDGAFPTLLSKCKPKLAKSYTKKHPSVNYGSSECSIWFKLFTGIHQMLINILQVKMFQSHLFPSCSFAGIRQMFIEIRQVENAWFDGIWTVKML